MNLEMKREALRVEPISTFLDRRQAPVSPVTRAGNMIFVAGLPPFDDPRRARSRTCRSNGRAS
ncbi:enamine deaminase RidA (YjgF/YER057c/UK114 family) [Bradyrhizobium sp. GM5.1]